MSTRHPTYSNPILVEAVCELHFELSHDRPWTPAIVGEIYKKILNQYPTMEPLSNLNVRFEFGPEGFEQRLLQPEQRMRFIHKTGQFYLQVGRNTIAINVLAPYPGWDAVRNEILRLWGIINKLLGVESVTRIGLRYINRISRQSKNQTPGAWFQATEYIPSGVLGSRSGFLVRTQVQIDEDQRLTVTLGDTPEETENPYGTLIFDIDRIVEKRIPIRNQVVSTELTRLHEYVWNVFAGARTEKLIQWMEGQQE